MKKRANTAALSRGAATKRYARTPENILVALGFAPSRENKLKLKYWATFPDWPRKYRNGHDISELKTFLDVHFEEFLADAKRAKGIEQGDKFSGGDLKLLRGGKVVDVGSGAGAGDPAYNGEPEVMGYEGIAGVLREHFRMPVSKMDISDWCHGKRLDHGVPNFPPPKASGRFNKLEAINWFRQHKFHDPRESATPDLFKRLETERATGELERLEHERIMRAVERGQFIEKAEHNRVLAGLGKIGRDNLWELFDVRAYQIFPTLLTALPEEWAVAALNALRELNPELLKQHHEYLEGLIKAAEEDGEQAGSETGAPAG